MYGGTSNHYGIMLKAYNESNSAKTFGTNNNSSLGPNIIVEYDPAVTGISLSSTCKEVNVGWSGYISATVYPASALNKTVYWESSDSNVASINPTSGLICAGLAGSTVITATTADGGFKATCTLTVKSTDPFHPCNIEYVRIKKYDQSQYDGDSDITTIVTKSYLSTDLYFEAYAPDRANVAFKVNSTLINGLNEQEASYQSWPNIGVLPNFYFHLAKLGVDEMVTHDIISTGSVEYYGIWASEANRLLVEADKISSQIQLALATVTAVYSIYNIVSAVKSIQMAVNTTQTLSSTVYKAAAENIDDMFDELSRNGTKFTKEKTMWITRRPNGQVSWLETGSESAGFQHILKRHPVDQFASLGVKSEADLSSFIYQTITNQTSVGRYGADGSVFALPGQKYLNVVISSNGYIVTTHLISDVDKIIFY